jgi:hypothetical protein
VIYNFCAPHEKQMKKLVTAFALLLITLAVGAQAQQAPSSAHVAAALALVRTLNFEQHLQDVTEARTQPGIRRDITMRIMKQRLNIGAFENVVARIYAETFNEAELRQLADFYATPLGRKLNSSQSAMTRRVVQGLASSPDVVTNLVVSSCAAAAVSSAAEQHQKLQLSMGRPSPTVDEVLAATGPLLARAEESCNCMLEKAKAAAGGTDIERLMNDPRAKAAVEEAARSGACPRPI